MSLVLSGAAVVFFSIMAIKVKELRPVLFMLTAGASIMLGLYWFDVYTTDVGLGISLMIILYSFMCLGAAHITLLRPSNNVKED